MRVVNAADLRKGSGVVDPHRGHLVDFAHAERLVVTQARVHDVIEVGNEAPHARSQFHRVVEATATN